MATTGASSAHGTTAEAGLRASRALVSAGLGIALIPRLGRSELGADLVAVRLHDPTPTRDVIVVHRRSMGASPSVTAVRDALHGHGRPGSDRRRRADQR